MMNAHSQSHSVHSSLPISAYRPPEFRDASRLKKIQALMPEIDKIYRDYAEKHHFPGFAYGIMVDGQLIHRGNGGFADLKKKIPMDENVLFRVASITKSFTAMAIVKLRDAGLLQLDSPIKAYLPSLAQIDLPTDLPEIRIRDLLTQSAGFPLDNAWGDRQLNMPRETFTNFIKAGLSFSTVPGTTFEYSNLGYALLGLIVEKASGLKFQDYIAQNIWQPIGLEAVAWEKGSASSQQWAEGYRWQHGKWQQEALLGDGAFAPMGGMFASLKSLSQYVAFHQAAWPARDDKEVGPIKRSSLREMQQAARFQELNAQFKFLNGRRCAMAHAYGYGLRWSQDCEGKTYVGHSGGLPGFGSNWLMLPDYGIAVILFANLTYAPAGDINLQVLDVLIQKAQLQPRAFPSSPLLKQRQKSLVVLLQNWDDAKAKRALAGNFFSDASIAERKKISAKLFKKIGKLQSVTEITAQNQLSGYFIIQGDKASLKVSMMLTPENPALIQEIAFKILKKTKENHARIARG